MIRRWHQNRVVRKAARRLTQHIIPWAVIAPSAEQESGWDYHLIPVEWGYEAAQRRADEWGGRIIRLLPYDTWSSASRQHYIETGRYLRPGEAWEA